MLQVLSILLMLVASLAPVTAMASQSDDVGLKTPNGSTTTLPVSKEVFPVSNSQSPVDLLKAGGSLYAAESDFRLASAEASPAPTAPKDPQTFINSLKPVTEVDRINGGSYWLYARLNNATEQERWAIHPYNAVIDRLHIYLYRKGEVFQVSRGYLYPFEYAHHYAADFDWQPGENLEILVQVESRYFSGPPRFEIVSEPVIKSDLMLDNMVIISSLGAITVLAIYNLFLWGTIKDRSYLYYSLYLLASVVAWGGAFNSLSQMFHLYSEWLLISPFFLTVALNTLYFIHFLELRQSHRRLANGSYLFAAFCFLMILAFPLFTLGQYMVVYGMTSSVWLLLGLGLGIYRLHQGYKPARIFVLAFFVLFVGTGMSLLHLIGFIMPVDNNYMITLVAQTLDVLLLSLALADRINILREEKEQALKQAVNTEHRAMATEHKANQKLQQALKLSEQESENKSEFLRMVSHELRTPLHSILSSVDQWNEADNDFHKQDLLNYISYGAVRLRTQIDNLVVLAETDNKNLQPSNHDFELRPLLDRLCANASGLLQESVDLIYTLPGQSSAESTTDELPLLVYGDAYLIEHLFRSVLENACKYTGRGQVEFKVIWSEFEQSLWVDVIDTGCGISREQQKQMFNAFVQVSRGLERKSEGLGLGLTICYRLSEVLSADLTIDSEVDQGTHVRIRLPLQPSTNQPLTEFSISPHKGRVLVVEDNLVNAQVLERLVSHLGYQVDVVYSGQEAIERLNSDSFNVILMDIQMPVMDGITATRWIRRRGLDTPIVAVTANSDVEVRTRCKDVGMNDFMVKPISRVDLERVLERQYISSRSG